MPLRESLPARAGDFPYQARNNNACDCGWRRRDVTFGCAWSLAHHFRCLSRTLNVLSLNTYAVATYEYFVFVTVFGVKINNLSVVHWMKMIIAYDVSVY